MMETCVSQTTGLADVPDEILEKILCHTDVPTVGRVARVCHRWRNVVYGLDKAAWVVLGIEELDTAKMLYDACNAGAVVVVRALIRAGVDVNEVVATRRPALQVATINGHFALVETLLQAGARIDALDMHHCTALLHVATQHHTAIARLLLRYGANPDIANYSGYAALHRAASAGNRELVDMLLRVGAIVDIRTNDDNTPLLMATIERYATPRPSSEAICPHPDHAAVIRLLREAGADDTLANVRGRSPASVTKQGESRLVRGHFHNKLFRLVIVAICLMLALSLYYGYTHEW